MIPNSPPPRPSPRAHDPTPSRNTGIGTASSSASSSATASSTTPLPSSSKPQIIKTRVYQGSRVVPDEFQYCEMEDLLVLITYMLNRLTTHNDLIPLLSSSLTRFHSRAPPSISIQDYLRRIVRFTNVSSSNLLLLIPYIDLACEKLKEKNFTINSLTIHRFVIAGICVGCKGMSDSFCTNGRYAKVGGISNAEMNLLEREFCDVLDWKLVVQPERLSEYYTSLVSTHPSYVRASDVPPPSPSASTSSSLLNSTPSIQSHELSSGQDVSMSSSAESTLSETEEDDEDDNTGTEEGMEVDEGLSSQRTKKDKPLRRGGDGMEEEPPDQTSGGDF